MQNEEWSGSRVAAALARLEDEGYPQSRLARMTTISQSTISRWGNGKVRPGYDAVRRLAAAVWRQQPDLARELVEASGYPWREPSPAESPPPTPLEDLLGSAEEAERIRDKIRIHKGRDAPWYISALDEWAASQPPGAGDDECPGRGAPGARREG